MRRVATCNTPGEVKQPISKVQVRGFVELCAIHRDLRGTGFIDHQTQPRQLCRLPEHSQRQLAQLLGSFVDSESVGQWAG